MTPTYSAVLTSPIGEIGYNVQENQLISLEFLKKTPVKSYALTHALFVNQYLTKYFSKLKQFIILVLNLI